MKKLFLSLLIAGFLLPLTPALVFAEEEAPGGAEEVGDDTQYSYATVVSVSDKEIVVSEYDYEKDESVNVTYSLDPAVKLRNIGSLKEIAGDDAVEIIYTVKDGKKMATAIAVDKNTGDEAEEGGEEPTEQPAGQPSGQPAGSAPTASATGSTGNATPPASGTAATTPATPAAPAPAASSAPAQDTK